MKILVVNGPNLGMLGKREPDIYGSHTLQDIEEYARIKASALAIDLSWKQSNIEGQIVDYIEGLEIGGFEGLIINPGAYAHTSIAIYDALKSISVPKIEVHLSNTSKREEFRQIRLTAKACNCIIEGLGKESYSAAIFAMTLIQNRDKGVEYSHSYDRA